MGKGELASLMISGISVQPGTTASQPSAVMRAIPRCMPAPDSGLHAPAPSSAVMMRSISSRSVALGRTH